MAKVSIDADKCIGCGTCVALCPGNFTIEGAKAVVTSPEDTGCAKQAVNNCPVNAIRVK